MRRDCIPRPFAVAGTGYRADVRFRVESLFFRCNLNDVNGTTFGLRVSNGVGDEICFFTTYFTTLTPVADVRVTLAPGLNSAYAQLQVTTFAITAPIPHELWIEPGWTLAFIAQGYNGTPPTPLSPWQLVITLPD
jgi:hypothetical protein